jgi:hypothetical protein
VGDKRLLDFDARDVLAAGDDDVLAAVAELDIAVGVPDCEVAGVAAADGAEVIVVIVIVGLLSGRFD